MSARSTALASLLLALGTACIDPTTASPAPDAGPPRSRAPDCLRLPDEIDFGEIERTGRGDAQYFLNNNTLKSLAIEIGTLDEPFFTSISGPAVVHPAVPFPLRISFLPPDGRVHFATLDFLGGQGCERQSIALRGMGAGELIGPSFFDFGAVPVGQTVSRRLTIISSRRTAVEGTVTVSGQAFTGPAAFSIPALGALELELTATASSLGLFNGALELASQSGDRVLIGLAASGGVPQLQLDRTTVRVNQLPASNTPDFSPLFQRTITLKNAGDGPLRIEGFSVRASPGSDVDEVRPVLLNNVIAPGASTSLLIQLQPRPSLGPRSWSIRLSTNQPNLPVTEIPITAEVVRLPDCGGAMQVSPASFAVPAGTLPVQAQITITNPFDTECLLDDLRLAPPLWPLSVGDQLVLPAHGSAAVTIALDRAGTSALLFNAFGGNVGYSSVTVRVE